MPSIAFTRASRASSRRPRRSAVSCREERSWALIAKIRHQKKKDREDQAVFELDIHAYYPPSVI